MFESIELRIQLVEGVYRLIHSHYQLGDTLRVLLLEELKLINAHKFICAVGRL